MILRRNDCAFWKSKQFSVKIRNSQKPLGKFKAIQLIAICTVSQVCHANLVKRFVVNCDIILKTVWNV